MLATNVPKRKQPIRVAVFGDNPVFTATLSRKTSTAEAITMSSIEKII
jgi:hypothetical protein